MAAVNPGETLTTVKVAGTGTEIDLSGGSGAMLPGSISAIIVVTGWAASYDVNVISAYPAIVAGLEVALVTGKYVRVAECLLTGNGNFKMSAQFPAEFARVTLDAFDSRIDASNLSVTAYVGGGQ